MSLTRPERGPGPRTLAERLGRLNDALAGLGGQVREAIAGTVGDAAGEAVRAAVRSLLGRREPPPPWTHHPEDAGERWSWPDSAGEDEPPLDLYGAHAPPRPSPSRWRGALASAARA